MSTVPIDPQIGPTGPPGPDLDVARDSDVPISTQIYWQLVYQIDSGRLLPGARLLPVRELGAALRVNPNTIRAVYRRLADAGYVMSRHGAGTVVADRPPTGRRPEALAGIVSELIRRAAHAGFLAHEVSALPAGSRVGVVCASERSADSIAETLEIAGTKGIEVIRALMDDREALEALDRTADLILLSRDALASGLDARLTRPERVRPWTYEFDPAGLEHLRRAVEHVVAGRA